MDGLTFGAPARLLLLLLVPALVAAYVLAQRRRPRYAVRFPELDLLRSVLPRRRTWLRHLPSAALLLSLVGATTAFAKPSAQVDVPRERATVVVALDVSASMAATDVSPDRFSAAKAAAVDFVEGLPDTFDVGLVSFAGTASVQATPTTDHAAVVAALQSLQLAPGTAIGDAVGASLDAITAVEVDAGQQPPPAQVVLLSDGANTVGRSVEAGVRQATAVDVPVTTIAYGTAEGVVRVEGQQIRVPVDAPALAALAEDTGGRAYEAASGDELEGVYDDIASRVGSTTEQREVTAGVAGLALLAGLGATGGGLLLAPRLT